MSSTHETFSDDLAAYALGILAPQETARIEHHLGECAECRQLLREFEEVMRLLPLGLPLSTPSPAARRELFHRVRSNTSATTRGIWTGWWNRVRLYALTAAIVVIAVLGGAFYWDLTGDDDGEDGDDAATVIEELRSNPNTQIIPMLGSENAPQAVAQLFFQPGRTRAGLVVSGLPPLPESRAYQLWFVHPDKTRYDGGTFSVDSSGQAIVAINAPAEYAPGWSCGVTEEPAGGSTSPTGPNVLLGSYLEYEW